MEQYASTTDGRASEFQSLHSQAQQVQVDPDAFGYMFGRMVYSSYAQHAQSVNDGLAQAANTMSEISGGVRESSSAIQDVDSATSQAAAQAVAPATEG